MLALAQSMVQLVEPQSVSAIAALRSLITPYMVLTVCISIFPSDAKQAMD